MSDSKPAESKSAEKKSMMQEFINFLQTFGIIGLAIAFVIGTAVAALIASLVNNIINPIIGLVLPAGSLSAQTFTVPSIFGTPDVFTYGAFINQLIDFIVVAFIIFLAYKQLSKRGLVEDKTKK